MSPWIWRKSSPVDAGTSFSRPSDSFYPTSQRLICLVSRQDKVHLRRFTDTITNWTGKPYNRIEDSSRPPPLGLNRFQATLSPAPVSLSSSSSNPQKNTSGPYSSYTIAFAISPTTTSSSSTDSRQTSSDVFPHQAPELGGPIHAHPSASDVRTHSSGHSSAPATGGYIPQNSLGLTGSGFQSRTLGSLPAHAFWAGINMVPWPILLTSALYARTLSRRVGISRWPFKLGGKTRPRGPGPRTKWSRPTVSHDRSRIPLYLSKRASPIVMGR